MKSLHVRIRHTADTIDPMHRFVCESPAVDREVLVEGKTDGGVRTLLFYVDGDREAYEAVLADRPDVLEYDVTPDGEDAFFLYVRARNDDSERDLLDAFEQDTVVVAGPVVFHPDMTMELTVVGHAADLQAVVESLPAGMDVDVTRVGEYAGWDERGLTDRQREALRAAWRVGYYEVPRDDGVEAVAAEMDCAVSTASTLLRRAESTLVGNALDAP
ncbi:helix-turn-helix domain-containing protein [Halorubellus litoreus]|uniref:Helix-turn-helix domain-containing protein n=1 Tax=Halorubellus litoreus TaxID=755308 RepID=A0ABD5VCM5_9EURY